MLTVFRRHIRKCPHTSRRERRCNCPLAVEGILNGEKIRHSLRVRSFEAAQKIVREWEVRGSVEQTAEMSVRESADRFYADKVAQRLRPSSLSKYELLCDELKREFSGGLPSVGIDELRRYRESWKVAPITARKKLDRLRTFFKFCHESGWIQVNPAKLLSSPKGQGKPVVPFSENELEKIIWATEVYPDKPQGRRSQVRAFVLLLRYSGLRIGDAVSLRREYVHDGKLYLRTAKTGTSVYLPIPDVVIESLERSPKEGEFYFWSGLNLRSAVTNWQRSLKTLFKIAGVPNAYPHRFRHTFACSLLSRGVSIENVAMLLGHSSSRITSRFYSNWIQSRQESLEADVSKAWNLPLK